MSEPAPAEGHVCDSCDKPVHRDPNGYWVGADESSDCDASPGGHTVLDDDDPHAIEDLIAQRDEARQRADAAEMLLAEHGLATGWMPKPDADPRRDEDRRALLDRALPMLIRLGDFVGNGDVDPQRPGSLCARCDLILDIQATAGAVTYPRKGPDGETVWACCESTIGPPCRHRRAP